MDVFAPYEQAEQQDQTKQKAQQHTANRAQTFDAAMRGAVDGLMAQPHGRVLLRWLLHLCRNFSAEDVGNAPESCQSSRLFYAEGQRMIGMRLMRLMQQANPGQPKGGGGGRSRFWGVHSTSTIRRLVQACWCIHSRRTVHTLVHS